MVHTGLLRHMRKEEGADSFIPLLIYVVIKANPDHLLSNVEYVLSGSSSRRFADYLARKAPGVANFQGFVSVSIPLFCYHTSETDV